MENIILAVIVILITGLAALYIYKSKKSGKKCIGCPDSGTCKGACSGCKGSGSDGCCGCSDN